MRFWAWRSWVRIFADQPHKITILKIFITFLEEKTLAQNFLDLLLLFARENYFILIYNYIFCTTRLNFCIISQLYVYILPHNVTEGEVVTSIFPSSAISNDSCPNMKIHRTYQLNVNVKEWKPPYRQWMWISLI